jgi:calcineurin-like phosphoesterase
MDTAGSIQRMKTNLPTRLETGSDELLQVNAVQYTLEVNSGICKNVRRINQILSTTLEGLPHTLEVS